eukprot:3368209-Lingulodinium_polyedra.AAC.1
MAGAAQADWESMQLRAEESQERVEIDVVTAMGKEVVHERLLERQRLRQRPEEQSSQSASTQGEEAMEDVQEEGNPDGDLMEDFTFLRFRDLLSL